MRKKNYVWLMVICAFLLASCTNRTAENAPPNQNKGGADQAGNDNFARDANVSANENSNVKTNTAADSGDKTDFEGTAGITDKTGKVTGVAVLRQVRTAQHEIYDRVTFEFEGAEMPGYHIEYIDKPVRQCGSGDVVALKGDGWLEVRFTPAQAHNEKGEPTVKNRAQNPDHKIIREIKLTCDFEADVTWVLGVASPNKYRVLELKNPTRLAVDIKH